MIGFEKFRAALIAALTIAATLAADGLTVQDGIVIALAFLGAGAVRQLPNRPVVGGGDLEAGSIDPGSLALGLLAGIVLMLFVFGAHPRY